MISEAHITIDKNDEYVATFGGEAYIDDTIFDGYGIQIGGLSVSGIPSETMILLACQMVDHLLLNGHRFEIVKTNEQDQKYKLVRKL